MKFKSLLLVVVGFIPALVMAEEPAIEFKFFAEGLPNTQHQFHVHVKGDITDKPEGGDSTDGHFTGCINCQPPAVNDSHKSSEVKVK